MGETGCNDDPCCQLAAGPDGSARKLGGLSEDADKLADAYAFMLPLLGLVVSDAGLASVTPISRWTLRMLSM